MESRFTSRLRNTCEYDCDYDAYVASVNKPVLNWSRKCAILNNSFTATVRSSNVLARTVTDSTFVGYRAIIFFNLIIHGKGASNKVRSKKLYTTSDITMIGLMSA